MWEKETVEELLPPRSVKERIRTWFKTSPWRKTIDPDIKQCWREQWILSNNSLQRTRYYLSEATLLRELSNRPLALFEGFDLYHYGHCLFVLSMESTSDCIQARLAPKVYAAIAKHEELQDEVASALVNALDRHKEHGSGEENKHFRMIKHALVHLDTQTLKKTIALWIKNVQSRSTQERDAYLVRLELMPYILDKMYKLSISPDAYTWLSKDIRERNAQYNALKILNNRAPLEDISCVSKDAQVRYRMDACMGKHHYLETMDVPMVIRVIENIQELTEIEKKSIALEIALFRSYFYMGQPEFNSMSVMEQWSWCLGYTKQGNRIRLNNTTTNAKLKEPLPMLIEFGQHQGHTIQNMDDLICVVHLYDFSNATNSMDALELDRTMTLDM